MAESSRISTSSTNDVPPLSKQQGNVSQNISQIPLIEANPKKRFKNLVECYPCIVDDCQILFDSKKELDEHKATLDYESHLWQIYNPNSPSCLSQNQSSRLDNCCLSSIFL